MNGKKITAFICSLLIVGNQIPFSITTSFAEEGNSRISSGVSDRKENEEKNDNIFSEPIALTVSDDSVSQLEFSKIYDGTTNVPNSAEIISGLGLSGVSDEDRDKVSLRADARYMSEDAGDTSVVISGFRLVFSYDADERLKDKYYLASADNIIIPAKIEKRKVCVRPSSDLNIVDNTTLPDSVPYDVVSKCYEHPENYILAKDRNKVNNTDATLKVRKNEDGTLRFFFAEGEASKTGDANYEFVLHSDESVRPSAPEKMQIISAVVSKNKASVLKQNENGICSNGSVYVDITAESSVEYENVKFSLSDSGGSLGHLTTPGYHNSADKELDLTDEEIESLETVTHYADGDGKYRYTARFEVALDEGEKTADHSDLTCIVDNGTESVNNGLELSTNGSSKKSNTLIIDKKEPAVASISPANHSDGRFFDFSGKFVDSESGISEILWRWDGDLRPNEKDNPWRSKTDFSHKRGDAVDIYDKVGWNDPGAVDTRGQKEGRHYLEVKVIDNAGNVSNSNYTTNGSDSEAPAVSYIDLAVPELSAWETIINFLSFGTFVNKDMTLTLKVIDKAEDLTQLSGVSSVELYDGNGENAVHLDQFKAKYKDGAYVFTISPNAVINDWYVKLTDNNNNYQFCAVSKLLKDDELSKKSEPDPDTAEENGEETTAAAGINWRENLKSNKWVVDSELPVVKTSLDDHSGIKYYNNYAEDFELYLFDELSGLRQWKFELLYYPEADTMPDPETESYVSQATYSSNGAAAEFITSTEDKKWSVDTSKDSKITAGTGWYAIKGTVEDNALNKAKEPYYLAFYVDHEKLSGSVRITDVPDSSKTEYHGENGDQDWIKKSDDLLTFRINVETKRSILRSAKVYINDSVYFEGKNIVLSSKDGAKYFDVSFDPTKQMPDEKQIYRVKAEFTTDTGNQFASEEYDLHVDRETPVIRSISVEKKSSPIEDILNVLSFGLFAKERFLIAVDADDINEYESGIANIKIGFSDNKTYDLKYENGKYILDLDRIDSELFVNGVFRSIFTLTVTDNVGRSSTEMPDKINMAGIEKSFAPFIMLEDAAPVIKVDMPEADSLNRTDGKLWYRRHIETAPDAEIVDEEKYITVLISDADSGIREVEMYINGKLAEDTASLELRNNALPTVGSTSAMSERNNSEHEYRYSIEKIAEFAVRNDLADTDGSGMYTITFKAADNACNVSVEPVDFNGRGYEDGKIVFYRDLKEPTITQFSFSPATVDDVDAALPEDFIDYLEYGLYFKRDFIASALVEDTEPSSGLDRVQFRLIPYSEGQKQEEEFYPVRIVDGKADFTVRAGFKGQVYAMAYDNVGNSSEEKTPQAFVSDETAPTIVIEPLPEGNKGKDNNGSRLYDGQVRFKVTITDRDSGLRTVSYSKKSENDSFDEIITEIGNRDGSDKSTLDGGWIIEETDVNLITSISQVFTFTDDDNDITLTFNATDRSRNTCGEVSSEPFTIDTIPPQIVISNSASPVNNMYYKGSTSFSISITERNFSDELIRRTITNSFTNANPSITFDGDGNSSSHNATVVFPEGDYTFSLSGSDLAGHDAVITFNGEPVSNFRQSFNVDAHAPIVKTNFGSFGKDEDMSIYFNAKQTANASITVTEHNFYAGDMGVLIEYMDAGTPHSADRWRTFSHYIDWQSSEGSDVHTANITLSENYVYRIRMNPHDRADNNGEFEKGSVDHTPVFEVDKEIPKFIGRDDIDSNGGTEKTFYVMYSQANKTASAPSVTFEDVNFDRIEYDYTICTPQYTNGYELLDVESMTNSSGKSSSVNTSRFEMTTLQPAWRSEEENSSDDNYKAIPDGVYVVTFTAVDKAGNRSEPISASYFRMVSTDVLAYIYNSEKAQNTDQSVGSGFYSLMNDKGMALSKKAADFSDLDILVIKPKADETSGKLVLREDEKEYFLNDYANFTVERDDISDTAVLEKMHIPGSYFSDTFKDDGLDTRMELSVSVRDGVYQWLGSIHIDNEIPQATLPDNFRNWHNYLFEKEMTITITGITETLDDKMSKVFECPRNGERVEIPHTYDAESGTYSFTLSKGVHHIDITLVDEAGNEWNIERVRYVRIGNFRLYLMGGSIIVIDIAVFLFFKKRRRQ